MFKKSLFIFLLLGALPSFSATGKEIYGSTCIACHGPNGKGAVPGAADFTLPKGVLSKDDKTLIKHITEGFQSPGSPMPMPAKGGNATLTDADIKSVLKYIRETFGPKKK